MAAHIAHDCPELKARGPRASDQRHRDDNTIPGDQGGLKAPPVTRLLGFIGLVAKAKPELLKSVLLEYPLKMPM